MSELSPIPYRVPIATPNGLIDRNWQQWFEALLARVGGTGDVTPVDEVAASSEGNEFNEDHAALTRLERMVQDLTSLQVFSDVMTQIVQEAPVEFVAVSPAELHALREQIQNLETMSAFT